MFITENIYSQSKSARTIALNCWYMVLLRNIRERLKYVRKPAFSEKVSSTELSRSLERTLRLPIDWFDAQRSGCLSSQNQRRRNRRLQTFIGDVNARYSWADFWKVIELIFDCLCQRLPKFKKDAYLIPSPTTNWKPWYKLSKTFCKRRLPYRHPRLRRSRDVNVR